MKQYIVNYEKQGQIIDSCVFNANNRKEAARHANFYKRMNRLDGRTVIITPFHQNIRSRYESAK